MTDEQIVKLYVEKKESAIAESKTKYGIRLFCIAKNILGNREDAEEIVNDTLLKAWIHVPGVRPEKLGAFLAKIARNLSINKWKARGAARRGGGEVSLMLGELEEVIGTSVTTEQEFDSILTSREINRALEDMDKEMRTTFVLRYFYGESIQSICDKLKSSESKIKSMLFRARKRLHNHLKAKGVYV